MGLLGEALRNAGQYMNNTVLSPSQEQEYQDYIRSQLGYRDTNMASRDYDMRGAFASGQVQNKFAGLENPGGEFTRIEGGHYTDTYKKPNHTTFSSGSQYDSPDRKAGDWVQGDNGQWQFNASPYNLINTGGQQQMYNYFHNVEPNASVKMPWEK